jgi:hypothetical protein
MITFEKSHGGGRAGTPAAGGQGGATLRMGIHTYIHPWLRWGFDPFTHLTALEGAEIIPGKNSDTRIKPLPLTNGHGRYMTVTPERTLMSVGKCPLNIWPLIFSVSILKPPFGAFRSETVIWIQKWFKKTR